MCETHSWVLDPAHHLSIRNLHEPWIPPRCWSNGGGRPKRSGSGNLTSKSVCLSKEIHNLIIMDTACERIVSLLSNIGTGRPGHCGAFFVLYRRLRILFDEGAGAATCGHGSWLHDWRGGSEPLAWINGRGVLLRMPASCDQPGTYRSPVVPTLTLGMPKQNLLRLSLTPE